MAFDRHFSIGLGWRVAGVAITLLALVYAFQRPDLIATRILALGIAAAAVMALWNYVRRTNVELARFIQAEARIGAWAEQRTGTHFFYELVRFVREAGRIPVQRDTLYNELRRW